MKRSTLAVLLLVLMGILVGAPMAAEAQAKLLKNIPVTGLADNARHLPGSLRSPS